MKKLLVTALFGAFAVAQETTTAAPAATSHTLLYQVDLDYRFDGEEYEGEHFLRYTYKFADGYKIMPAISFWTRGVEDGAGDVKWEAVHQFARVEWETPKWWDILGFKTSWRVRYNLPTTDGAQNDGTYGTISNRLMMEQEFNSFFNLTLIPKLGIVLNRNGHEKRESADETTVGDGNILGTVSLEILPQIKFSENLTLTYDADIAIAYKAEGVDGSSDSAVLGELNHELELMYTVAALGDLGVGVIVVNDEVDITRPFELDPGRSDKTYVGFRIAKSLDL